MGQVYLSYGIRRRYGAVDATFGAAANFEIDATFTTRQGYEVLREMTEQQFEHYEAHVLTREEHKSIEGRGAVGAAYPNTEEFSGVAIIRTQKGSKFYYAIKTAEAAYCQHGCPIYPEVLEKYPKLKAIADERGEYKFKDPLIVVIDRSGASKKVVKIEGAS